MLKKVGNLHKLSKDIDFLIQTDSLKDKLQVVKDSECTSDNIISILNHKKIDWTDKNNSKIINSVLTCCCLKLHSRNSTDYLEARQNVLF